MYYEYVLGFCYFLINALCVDVVKKKSTTRSFVFVFS